jgi:hypothetical protein
MDDKRAKIDERLKVILSLVPTIIDPATISAKAKPAFMAQTWDAALLLRSHELAESAVSLFDSQRFLPSLVCARSLMETVAIHYWLTRRVQAITSPDDIATFHEFLFRGLVGSKNDEEDMPTALHVLTAVRKVDKVSPGFLRMYDDLSEYVHPNQSGTLQSFIKTEHEIILSIPVKYPDHLSWDFVAAPILGSINWIIASRIDLSSAMSSLVAFCEEDYDRSST